MGEEFIEDGFNLTGISVHAQLYKEALEVILDVEPEEDEMSTRIPDLSILEPHAKMLYGMIHQRYIITRPGLNQMVSEEEAEGDYANLLSMDGNSWPSIKRVSSATALGFTAMDSKYFLVANTIYHVKVLYDSIAPTAKISTSLLTTNMLPLMVSPAIYAHYRLVTDAFFLGAHFGTTFPHLFAQAFPDIIPSRPDHHYQQQQQQPNTYVAKLFGFRVNERSKAGPRMAWLRMTPPPSKSSR